MIVLHDYELSGNCYKVRLLMHVLGLTWSSRQIDFYPGKEHKSAQFKRINPFGELPVLNDDGNVIFETQAILVYLALKYDETRKWFPADDALVAGSVLQWLGFANRITATASAARLHDALFYEVDVAKAREGAHALFAMLEEHLWFGERAGRAWICTPEHPTIADIACFPYVMLSEEGGISRQAYPALRRWTDRFKRIDRFMVMPGIFPAPPSLS